MFQFVTVKFIIYYSDLIASNSTDRQWYLNRIGGDSCKMTYIDTPFFSESPRPFNKKCNTTLELTMVIFAIIGWGKVPIFSGQSRLPF